MSDVRKINYCLLDGTLNIDFAIADLILSTEENKLKNSRVTILGPMYFGILSGRLINPLRDPRKYGRKVRELSFEEYKPWEISKHLPLPVNFTIGYKLKERKVEVWTIFPSAVEKAVEKYLGK